MCYCVEHDRQEYLFWIYEFRCSIINKTPKVRNIIQKYISTYVTLTLPMHIRSGENSSLGNVATTEHMQKLASMNDSKGARI